jgi:hypothetical protein
MAELHAFPTLLHVHLNHPFDALMSSRSRFNPGTTQSFSVIHHHTWGLRGASRGRDKLPLVYFAAIVPVIRPDSVSGFWRHRNTATRQVCLEFLGIGNDP